jgi:hypothetical protein
MSYLIDITDFNGRADLSANTLSAKVTSFIAITEETFIPPILCNELYDELKAEYAQGVSYMSPALASLLPYVKTFLVYKTYSRYLVSANAISTAAGMRVSKDSISDPASDVMMTRLINQAEKDANMYQDRLVSFLTRNAKDYPDWKNSQCGCKDIYVNSNNKLSPVGGKYKPKNVKWT